MSKQQQFTPRNGRTLRVIIVARISTIHQDMKSLDDQMALCKDYVTRRYSGPIEWTPIATQGSGEWLDREEILRLGELIESRKFDLVVTEDLGRICRRFQVIAIAEACQDSETRLIALNDGVDTDDESWKPLAAISALRHESYNKDTSNRIRRSHRNRFLQGGVIGCLLFCYEREPGAKTIDKVHKRPEMIPFVEGIFEKVESGASFSAVAGWLNGHNIPKGTRGKGAPWDAGNVGEFIRNPILKGLRVRNRKMSKRIHKTGRHRSVDAPQSERLYHSVPHLAFVDADRFDRLNLMLHEKNAHFRPGRHNGESLRSKPRSQTRWPGQHLVCGICGHAYVLGRNGQRDGLMCFGAKQLRCWNTAGISRPLASKKMMEAIFAELEKLPEFDTAMLDAMREEAAALADQRVSRKSDAEKRLQETESALANLMKVLMKNPDSETANAQLSALEIEKKAIELDLRDLRRAAPPALELPSVEKLREEFRREACTMTGESPEFCRLMRKIIPGEIVIRPYQAVLGNVVVCRAELTLELGALLAKDQRTPAIEEALTRKLEVEVDERAQRHAFAIAVGRMREEGKKYDEIGSALGITGTAAQHAMKVYKAMQAAGASDAFVVQHEPLSGDKRKRRHLNPRYQFFPKQPEPGASAQNG